MSNLTKLRFAAFWQLSAKRADTGRLPYSLLHYRLMVDGPILLTPRKTPAPRFCCKIRDMAAEAPEKTMLEQLREDNKRMSDRIVDLERQVASQPAPYQLIETYRESDNRLTTRSYYDGLVEDPPVFLYHEAISYREDAGFDMQILLDRSMQVISRAITPQRCGPNMANLPRFDPQCQIEVIVAVYPATEE